LIWSAVLLVLKTVLLVLKTAVHWQNVVPVQMVLEDYWQDLAIPAEEAKHNLSAIADTLALMLSLRLRPAPVPGS
jgi:hypothetical protein